MTDEHTNEHTNEAQERLKAYKQRHARGNETALDRWRREWRELLSRAPDDGVFSKLHELDALWVAMFEDDHFDAAFEEVKLLAEAVTNTSHPKHHEAQWLLNFLVGGLRIALTDLLKDHPYLGKPKTK